MNHVSTPVPRGPIPSHAAHAMAAIVAAFAPSDATGRPSARTSPTE